MTTPDNGIKAPPTRLLGICTAIGPGIVVIGSVMGSGELINTPVQAAKFGFVLLWAVIISCLIKYFLQVEFGRHALAHNRTPFESLATLPGGKRCGDAVGIAFMIGFAFALFSFTGMMRATAGMFHDLMPLVASEKLSVDIWQAIVAAATLAILWRDIYREMEKLVTLLVFGFSFSVVVAVVLIQTTEHRITSEQVLAGASFSLGNDSQLAAYAVISLLGALGATANEIFMYPYWILEKGYGGFVGSPDSDGWAERTRGWIRVMQFDVGLCTILATVITAAYFLIGAAVFYGKGDPPSGDDVVDQLSAMFTESFRYGAWSKGVFLFGAFCTLFSTLVVGIAAAGRMWGDMFASLGAIKSDHKSLRGFHRSTELFYLIVCCLIGWFVPQTPEALVIFAQYVTGLFSTPLIMIAICWIAFRTDARVRMNWVSAVFLIASVIVIAACLALGIAQQAGLLGGE